MQGSIEPYHEMDTEAQKSASVKSSDSSKTDSGARKPVGSPASRAESEMSTLTTPNASVNPADDHHDDQPLLLVHKSTVKGTGLKSMPPAIWYIVFNEACERFTYYGLSGILALFLEKQLSYTKSISSSIVLYFQAVVYFSPVIGGYLSDSHFGKYKIIISFSVVYVVGTLGLAMSAVNNTVVLTFVALLLIGFGTGGIKPCVSSFGADQLPAGPDLPKRTETFFAIFYFSINLGSVLAFVAPPYISEAKSLGYSYAFGLPALFMIFSIFVIWFGRRLYWHSPIKGSVVMELYHVYRSARQNKKRAIAEGEPPLRHWIDYAIKDHGKEAAFDAKSVWRLGPIFLLLPVFWTLYNQQQSVWVLQADDMDLTLGSFKIATASVQIVNPILIMIFLPLSNKIVYPFFTRIGWHPRPLRRMVVGMFLTVISFLLSAGVQKLVDDSIARGEPNTVSIFYQFPQLFVLSAAEILVSVTSLEFSYAEAPVTMKSVISAVNLLTTSVGSLLAASVYAGLGGVLEQKFLLILFAGMMFVNTLAFIVVAQFYVYVNDSRESKQRSGALEGPYQNDGDPSIIDKTV